MLVKHKSKYIEWKPGIFRTVFSFICDGCGIEFETQMKKSRRETRSHFCNIDCANNSQKRGGNLDIKRREGFQERLGVAYPMQCQEIRNKSVQRCLDKYGVKNVQQVSEINARTCNTFLQNLEKRQRFLGCWVSKSENRFYEDLKKFFNEEDIIRQKRVKPSRRPIDFFISSIETYIQFDGVYWHGLDRPIEEIELCRTKHDQEIHVRFHADRAQDKWFQEQGLKLIRITDVEYDTFDFEILLERIKK